MLPTKYTSQDTNVQLMQVHVVFYGPLIVEITELDFCYFRVELKYCNCIYVALSAGYMREG